MPMRFSKTLSIVALTIVAVLLSACSSSPKVADRANQANVQQAGPDTVDGDENSAAQAPQFSFDLSGPGQNPYLQQDVNISGAVRALFADAVAAMQNQQWSQAESLLLQLTEQYPELSGPLLNLGIVYRQLNQLNKAERAFTQAVAVNNLNIDALNQLALLKREQGDFKAAEVHYLAALAVWPRHDITHKNLGILYDMYMGEFNKAVEHFEIYQFLQAGPDRRVSGWIIDLKRRIKNLQVGA